MLTSPFLVKEDKRHWVRRESLLGRGLVLVATIFMLFSGARAEAQRVAGCGSLENAFGPFDYRDPAARGEPLKLVESAHFTPSVESLTKGSTGAVIGDLDYTLRAFPNHHRALNSVARYELQGGSVWTNPAVKSAQCYFERAIAFRSDDHVVRMLYANYLVKSARAAEARRQYEDALRMVPNDAEVNYNAGLFFLSQGEISRARQLADIAYARGYPLPGLRNKLAEVDARRSP